jgi:hypothetical protein
VGADHRGPLAAFIVVAIIAVVLLVTSVRSQAAPGWLDPGKVPATAVVGPVAEPHVWGAASGAVQQAVQEGVVLAPRVAATGDAPAGPAVGATGATGATAGTATPGTATPGTATPGTAIAAARPAPRVAPGATHHSHQTDSPDATAPVRPAAQVDGLLVTHEHGLHEARSLGSSRHHGAMAWDRWSDGNGVRRS